MFHVYLIFVLKINKREGCLSKKKETLKFGGGYKKGEKRKDRYLWRYRERKRESDHKAARDLSLDSLSDVGSVADTHTHDLPRPPPLSLLPTDSSLCNKVSASPCWFGDPLFFSPNSFLAPNRLSPNFKLAVTFA